MTLKSRRNIKLVILIAIFLLMLVLIIGNQPVIAYSL